MQLPTNPQQLLALVALLVACMACAPAYYPGNHAVPMTQETGQVAGQFSVGTNGIDAQVHVQPAKNLIVYGQGSYQHINNYNPTEPIYREHWHAEGGIGVVFPFADAERERFSLWGHYAQGSGIFQGERDIFIDDLLEPDRVFGSIEYNKVGLTAVYTFDFGNEVKPSAFHISLRAERFNPTAWRNVFSDELIPEVIVGPAITYTGALDRKQLVHFWMQTGLHGAFISENRISDNTAPFRFNMGLVLTPGRKR